jgi:hypothetical protein
MEIRKGSNSGGDSSHTETTPSFIVLSSFPKTPTRKHLRKEILENDEFIR